ncbi:DUF3857 domain-containing transglutaminase family protein [Arenimonas terrae]|uniref:DUF3857 domain-containing protein n=1 Tax=Arenimonas terrae TaxID=2546226 RepID=A0A5C4RRQ2_9GAMM|nr:DUF3857 domain-containing protein [Arenimonas terrae]TNJ33762.1 DUF3857 domain-containing protein [Arenimonas terrae]
MRRLWWLVLAMAVLPAWAGEVVHERGEYRFTVAPEPGFVVPVAVPDTWKDEGVEAPWRYWLLDRQVDRRGGRHLDHEVFAYEARSTATLGSAARFSVNFSPQFQTLTIHRVELRRDGRWLDRLVPEQISLARREAGFEEDLSDGSVTALIVLEDVRVGDVIRIAYTIDGSNPILEGNTADGFLLAWSAPIALRTGRILFDPGTRVEVLRQGTAPAPERAQRPDALELSFRLLDIEAIRDLGGYPNWFNPYPRLQISEQRRWSDIVDWALRLYPADAAIPAELQLRVAQWRKLGSAHERAAAALKLVQEEVRYFGVEMGDNTHKPHAPAVTWQRRYGDCKDKTQLLVALLRELDIEAVPALVSTSRGLADELPAASAFNHVIARARIDGQDFWLDATRTGQRGDLRQMDLGTTGLALPVARGSDRLVEMSAPEKVDNGVEVVEHFVLDADKGTAELRVRTQYRGARAERARLRLQSQTLERMSEDFSNYYRKRYGDLTVASPTQVSQDEDANRLVVEEHYRLAAPVQRDGDRRYLESFAETLSADAELPGAMDRTAPLELDRPARLRHEVRVDLPPGWVLSTLPGETRATAGPASYRRKIGQDGGTVSVVHELKWSRDHVTEGEIADYIGAIRDIRDHMGINLSFGMPTPIESRDRDRRLKALLRGAMQEADNDEE